MLIGCPEPRSERIAPLSKGRMAQRNVNRNPGIQLTKAKPAGGAASMDMRHLVFRGGLTALRMTGAARLLASRTRGLGAVLMLHHVRPAEPRAFAPNRLLEITPAFLDTALSLVRQQGFEIVRLDAVPELLARADLARPFVAITLDDGYRDNLEHALPVFRRHGAPFTVFVTSGFAEATAPLWWIDLEEAIRRLDRVALDPQDGQPPLDLPAGSDREKRSAFAAVYARLRAGPEETLRASVTTLGARAGLDPLATTRRLCLDWEGLRALAADPLATFGAHTVTHPMLAKHTDTAARREMALSRLEIERNLGARVNAIAYPVGDPGSAGPREFALAAELGFKIGLTTRPGMLFPEHAGHPTALPRLSVNGLYQSAGDLRTLLSGTAFALFNRGRRLNVG
jgi:peptidoglycan/xylan/chitin deacetylase (PgdA/CDA1 family)